MDKIYLILNGTILINVGLIAKRFGRRWLPRDILACQGPPACGGSIACGGSARASLHGPGGGGKSA